MPRKAEPLGVLDHGPHPEGHRLMEFGGRLYRVRPLPFGGVRFEYDDPEQPGKVVDYSVWLEPGRESCECQGFLRWGHCRHLKAATAFEHHLLKKLPAVAVPVEI